jgi:hypothetical protein
MTIKRSPPGAPLEMCGTTSRDEALAFDRERRGGYFVPDVGQAEAVIDDAAAPAPLRATMVSVEDAESDEGGGGGCDGEGTRGPARRCACPSRGRGTRSRLASPWRRRGPAGAATAATADLGGACVLRRAAAQRQVPASPARDGAGTAAADASDARVWVRAAASLASVILTLRLLL